MTEARAEQDRKPESGRAQGRSIRFASADLERLRALARRWGCSEAAAARRAVALAAERELSAPAPTPEERRAAVDAAVGALAHVPGSLEEFLRRKREEIELEEEIWTRRRVAGDRE